MKSSTDVGVDRCFRPEAAVEYQGFTLYWHSLCSGVTFLQRESPSACRFAITRL
jgi:hypothetical protein